MQQVKNKDDSFLAKYLTGVLRGWTQSGFIPVEEQQVDEAVDHARRSGLVGLVFYLVLGLVLIFSYAVAAVALITLKDASTYVVFASANFVIYSALYVHVSRKTKKILSYSADASDEVRVMLNLIANLIHMAVGISYATCIVFSALVPSLLFGSLGYSFGTVLIALLVLFFFCYRFDNYNHAR